MGLSNKESRNNKENRRIFMTGFGAWAPDFTTRGAWEAWDGVFPTPVSGGSIDTPPLDTPSVNEVWPKLQNLPLNIKRRLNPFGKLAMASWFNQYDTLSPRKITQTIKSNDTQPSIFQGPIVFCSRHGDLKRTIKLIKELEQQEGLSPARFSLSVHNAVVGLLSMFTKNTSPYTAISAYEHVFDQAMLEVLALLATGAPSVRLIYCDLAIKEVYGEVIKEKEVPMGAVFEFSKSKFAKFEDSKSSTGLPLLYSPISEKSNNSDQSNNSKEESERLGFTQGGVLSFLSFVLGHRSHWTLYPQGIKVRRG